MNVRMPVSKLMPALAVLVLVLSGCERPPMESTQLGYRGTGQVETTNPRLDAELREALDNIPDALPAVQPTGTTAAEAYQNVQVLGDLDTAEFVRFMSAITQWVSPEQGCTYCHANGDFVTDNVYTKIVSRRMIEMTRQINGSWSDHVGTTGVTCYTCHQGNNVPEEVWYRNPGPPRAAGFTAGSAGQNAPAYAAGLSSLPYDPFSPFLLGDTAIRTLGDQALPDGTTLPATKQTEETFSLMIHMSDSLGVNCTFCHDSRAFSDWQQSPPTRLTAWHGIRMARELNNRYIEPLAVELPDTRVGPLGDAPKINCATCHQGMSRPLMGTNMLQHHPELTGDN